MAGEMPEPCVIYGKHSDTFYCCPLCALKSQIDDWYIFESEEVLTRARAVYDTGSQRYARAFLWERSDYEYERFDTLRFEGSHAFGR